MTTPLKDLMSDGIAVPLGDIIAAVGRGVAEAQIALDAAALAQTLNLYDAEGDPGLDLLREIGYRPTFYVLPETVCEVQVSLTVGGSGGPDGAALPAQGPLSAISGPGRVATLAETMKSRTYVTPVDAGFANRYAYQAQAAAKLTFKVMPVPPPAGSEDARPIPSLVGLAFAAAAASLSRRDLGAEPMTATGDPVPTPQSDALLVLAQDPPAGAVLRAGDTVRLTLG